MLGDYRKLSTHNQLRQESEITTRVKMFKGKGRWLTALIVGVGAAIAVQGQSVTQAATSGATAPNSETNAEGNPEVVAAKTAQVVKLVTTKSAPKIDDTKESAESAASSTAEQTGAAEDQTAESSKPAATENAAQAGAETAPVTSEVAAQDAESIAPANDEQAGQDDQAKKLVADETSVAEDAKTNEEAAPSPSVTAEETAAPGNQNSGDAVKPAADAKAVTSTEVVDAVGTATNVASDENATADTDRADKADTATAEATDEAATASNANTDEASTVQTENADEAPVVTTGATDGGPAVSDSTADNDASVVNLPSSPEVKTAVDPVSATQADTLTWKTVEDPATISLSRIVENDGKSYTFTIKPGRDVIAGYEEWGYPLFNNTVTDNADQIEHTYTHANGDTAAYYMRDLTKGVKDYQPLAYPNHDREPIKYETSTAEDGTPYLRLTTEDATDQLTITETLSVDASGSFNHTVTIRNNGTATLSKVKFGTLVDTSLDEADGIPIYSNGDGSATISNATKSDNGLTLYFTPTDNDTLIVGNYKTPNESNDSFGDMLTPEPVTGKPNGKSFESNGDTAEQFETPELSLAPGATTSYSYSEHLYVQQITTSTITVKYQDEGHTTLQPDTTTGGVVGSPFVLSSQAKTIDGYTYLKTEGNVTDFTKDPQTVTLIFQKTPVVKTQTATITYQDVTDNNKTLGDVDSVTGDSGTTSSYSSAERIKAYTDQGYKLVSDGTKDGIVFDSDDDADQPFIVQLAHDVADVTPEDPHDAKPSDFSATATRVIKYVNPSTPTKVPTPATQTQTANLTRTGTEDLVTKEVTFSDWQAGTVAAIDSPEVAGYTPDQTTVQAASFSTPDVDGKPSATVTVTYSTDEQTAVVTFVDQANNTLLPSQTITGKTDAKVDHSQIASSIQAAMDKGYTVSKDGTIGATFDHNSDSNQTFVVVLVPVENASVTTTLVPQGPDGKPLTPAEPKTFSGKPGDPINETDYPDVPGYTPDEGQTTVVPNKPGDTIVKYVPKKQTATVSFVDKSGQQLITPDQTITGDSDTAVDHTQLMTSIQKVINQGYSLVDDRTVGAAFDHYDDKDQKFTVTFTENPRAELTTTLVPMGPNDQPLTPTTPKQVTGFPGDPISDTDYPDVPGYTPDPNQNQDKKVPKEPGETTIIYTPNTQTATVSFVDKSGQQLITPDQTITGDSDTAVDHTQLMTSIQKVINQGYSLVDDHTVGAAFDHYDDKDQKFTVTFTQNPRAELTTTLVPKGPNDQPLTPTTPKQITGFPGDPISDTDYPDVPGYTPDPNHNKDKKVPNEPGETTIIYIPNTQTATVSFVDESGKQLITPDQTVTGDSDTAVGHSQIATSIQKVIGQGYVLTKDGTVGATFDHNDKQPQRFTVVFGQVPKAELTTTLVPKGPNDQPLTPTTPKQVTGFPGDPISDTDYPDVPGYTPDPNQNQDKKVPNEPGETTIIYIPNTQTATVSFVDESGKQLITPDQTVTGDSDTAVGHSQIATSIQKVIGQGYVLTKDGTVGATFDHKDGEQQKFTVVFGQVPKVKLTTPLVPKGPNGPLTPTTPVQITGFPGDPISTTDYPDVPGYTPIEDQNKKVPNEPGETQVDYTPNTQTAVVTYVDESGNQLITGQTITGKSDTAVDHSQLMTNIQKVINEGYVIVDDRTVGAIFDHIDGKNQKFTVTFGQVPKVKLTTTIVPKGPNGEPLTPTTPVQITGFPGDPISVTDYPDVPGYTPIEDQNKKVPNEPGETQVDYTPNTQTAIVEYVDESGKQLITPEQTVTGDSDTAVDHGQIATNIKKVIGQGFVLTKDGTVGAAFDHNDNQPQKFTVVFGQVPKAKLTTTIVPEGPKGQPLTPTTPKQVTGFPGDPISETDYPDVPGYTPNKNQNKLVPNEPGETTIEYTPNTQTAVVTYVDKSGKQLITPDQTISGDSDTAVVHSQITDNIQKIINHNYVLVSDGTVGATFDHNDGEQQKFTVVFGQVPKAELTTSLVPEGPNSQPLKPTTPKQVTGFPGDPISKMDYPDVPGYTPVENQNKKVPNEPGETTITYTPNSQTAIVKYVDESGNQLIADQTMTGKSDTTVDHSQLTLNIQKIINEGYVLVDDRTVGATFDHNDDNNQKFTVTFGQVPKAELTTTLVPKGPNGPLTPTTPVQITGFPGDPISATDYPDVPGYTPSKNQSKLVPNEPGETTIEYTPNMQTAVVTYVDKSGKQLITPDQTISGDSDTAVVHSQITDNIQKIINQNYVLVSDGTVGATFDHNDGEQQKFTVVFDQVPKAELTTTLVPKGPNGPLTPTTPVQITGFPGDPISTTDYPDVPGYTPRDDQDKVVPNEPGETTVEYTPNSQSAVVTYVDESGKELITPDQVITGDSDTVVGHGQIAPNIQKVIGQGYVLTKDGTVGATFDHNDKQPQRFTVVFGQVPKAELTTTLVPKGPNGPLTPTTPAQVTGFPGDPISETDYPDVPGYTPDKNQNEVVPNKPGDTTIMYTPNTQTAVVSYVDESGQQLITPDQTITGKSDTAVDHTKLMTNIQKVINEGYVLVDDWTVGATFDHIDDNQQKFTVVFGQVPKAELTTTLVPKGPNGPLTPTTPVQITGFPGDPISTTDYPDVPGYTPRDDQDKVVPNEPGETTITYTPNTQTAVVTYVDKSGQKLITPDQVITGDSDSSVAHSQIKANIQKAINQNYVLVSDGTIGATFDHIDDQPQKFTVVFDQIPKAKLTTTIVPKGPNGEPLTPTTPVQITGFPGDPISTTDYPDVPGYTPSENQNKVVPDEPGDTTVDYTANDQKAIVTYVDESGNRLITDQTITGKSDTAVDHAQLMANVQKVIDEGYVLVDDRTVGATFDHNDDNIQKFTVTFGQVPKAKLTTTIVPKGPNGEQLTPKTPVQITGFPGDPISTTDYPDVPGYTPSENQNKVVPDEPGETTIEYTPNTQTAIVTYIDKSGKQLITPDQVITGDSDTAVVHSQITGNIQKVINQSYVLVSDGTVGATFDHNDGKQQKFTVVFDQIPKAELTTTIVPKGPNGPLTPTTPVQITGFPGDPISTTDYPDVPGYTPSENQNKVVPDEPSETTIEYTPNIQTAIVTYVDKSGKQLITPDQVITGDSDTAVVHGQIKANIQKVINQNYVLVSDGTIGATFDHIDDQPQKFTVVFDQIPKAELTTTIVPKGPNGEQLTPKTPVQITGFPGDPISTTDYPDVPGYTPVENQNKVVPNEPGETTLEYVPNLQTATVAYVDGSGNHLIHDQQIGGKSDTPVDHAQITTAIQTVISQGYNLVSDGTVGAVFDHDDDHAQIFTVLFSKLPAPRPTKPATHVTPPSTTAETGHPGLPSTFGGVTTGDAAGDSGTTRIKRTSDNGRTTGKKQAAAQAQGQTATHRELPQTGDGHATSLTWLGATLMFLLGIADRRRKRDR
ncbi:mucin-binding protein [Lacticaseibacillus hulanensis]|uniref:mucin-binding protein n=1 Tax=Lacticaseibacillus hulanensis TaxID=2493111 RepID=UPI000FDA5388|nr:MucBP domain-containing protein [Lacticaseibacillus hulanensis]